MCVSWRQPFDLARVSVRRISRIRTSVRHISRVRTCAAKSQFNRQPKPSVRSDATLDSNAAELARKQGDHAAASRATRSAVGRSRKPPRGPTGRLRRPSRWRASPGRRRCRSPSATGGGAPRTPRRPPRARTAWFASEREPRQVSTEADIVVSSAQPFASTQAEWQQQCV